MPADGMADLCTILLAYHPGQPQICMKVKQWQRLLECKRVRQLYTCSCSSLPVCAVYICRERHNCSCMPNVAHWPHNGWHATV